MKKGKHLKISKAHFDYTLVVELKKSVNTLGEVILSDTTKQKTFNYVEYNQSLGAAIKQDMKLNSHLYKPEASIGGFNQYFLIQKLFSLLNKKQKETPNKTITYRAYDSLFTNDSFFND